MSLIISRFSFKNSQYYTCNLILLISLMSILEQGCAYQLEPPTHEMIAGDQSEMMIQPLPESAGAPSEEMGGNEAVMNPMAGGMFEERGGDMLGGASTDPLGGEQGGMTEEVMAGSLVAPALNPIEFLSDITTEVTGVRIRDNPFRLPTSLYQVQVTQLSQDERLIVNGEVMLSRCNRKDIQGLSDDAGTTPCNTQEMRDDPYSYDPVINAGIFISDRHEVISEIPVGEWVERRCTEARHHCQLSLPEIEISDLPAGDYWIHLGVTSHADGSNARGWHYMEVEMNKGQLNVARLNALHGVVQTLTTQAVGSTDRLRVNQTEDEGDLVRSHWLAYELPLTDVEAGDVLFVSSKFIALMDGTGDCNPMINSQIFLSERAGEVDPDQGIGLLTPRNGANCTNHGPTGCNYRKSGAIKLPAQLNTPLYLIHYATAHRSCAQNEHWFLNSSEGLQASVIR